MASKKQEKVPAKVAKHKKNAAALRVAQNKARSKNAMRSYPTL